jgi:hypothetical protein
MAVPRKPSLKEVYISDDYPAELKLYELTKDSLALSGRFWMCSFQLEELLSRVLDFSLDCFTRHYFPHSILHGKLQRNKCRKSTHILYIGQAPGLRFWPASVSISPNLPNH